MAAAPVRQRSAAAAAAAALRSQLPPCYYEGYLEKRGPREKVGPPGDSAMLSRLHVVASGGQGACACAGHRLISHSRGCQLPHCARMGEASGHWCCRRSASCRRSRVLMSAFGKILVGKRTAMCEQIKYQPLLSKHCHLHHVARSNCGSYLNQKRLPNISSHRNHVLIFVLTVSYHNAWI